MARSKFSVTKAMYGGYLPYFPTAARNVYRRYSAGMGRAGRAISRRVANVVSDVARAAAGPVVRRITGSPIAGAIASGAMRGYYQPYKRQYSSGMFTGRIGPKRFKRSRKQRKLAGKFRGVNHNLEVANTVTDDKCVYLMHSTFPALTVMKYAMYSLVKNILNNGGINFASFAEARAGRVTTGDTIGIEWKASVTSAVTITGYVVVVADLSYGDIAENFWTHIYNNLINNTAGFTSRAIILRAYWQTSAGDWPSELNLQGATVSILTKSALKMQNRSVNAAGDEEVDVNNVPLYGKGYEGSGNGFVTKSNNIILTPTDSVNAWKIVGAGANPELQEPPQLYHFQFAKGMKSVSISSGGIKTSVLYGKENISLMYLFRIANGMYFQTTDSEQFHKIGKTRMYALERPIAKIGAELGISVTAEHDFKMWIEVHNKKQMYTAPLNSVN